MGVFWWCGNSNGGFSLLVNQLIGLKLRDEERTIENDAKE